jgi:hypothetical protein
MLTNIASVPGIETMIAKGLQQVIDEEIDRVVDEAKIKVERNVRAASAGIAARVLQKFSFEKMGQDLVIRVEFPGAKE